MIVEACALIAFAVALRRVPARIAPHGIGVDQWFWKAYVEKLRGERKFPPDLPQFLLDKAQWYPPLFPVILAKLPHVVFERHAQYLAILVDMLRLLLLVFATRWLSGSDLGALIAGAAYAITPLLVSYNMQLNPRGLGALLLDALWICVAAVTLERAPEWILLFALLLSGLVLLTHKMTTQLLWFTALAGAALAPDARLALLVPTSMLAATLLSGGFYTKVLLGHVDVVTFWYRNWRWTGSNPVLESPLYGEPGFESATKYYRRGARAWVRRLQIVVGFNPWMPAVLLIALLAAFSGHPLSRLENWTIAWVAVTLTFALLTTLVPVLRCLGQGYLYGYNGSFPAALVLGMTWISVGETWYWQAVTGATVIACFVALAAFLRALRTSRTMKVDAALDAAIHRLAELPRGAVMCLPQQWHDVVAYRAGQPVVFGGHGYGFNRLQPVFPRLLVPVADVIAQYDVHYLLTCRDYCNARFLSDLPPSQAEEFGEYQLYRFKS